MKEIDYIIRNETPADHRETENLVREAFWNVYRPGCYEHFVLHELRKDPAFVPELNLVMEKGGSLIGQIMFMRAEIKCDDGTSLPIMTFGPIGILPRYKRQGYGKILLNFALERAEKMGCGAVCIEGNILFYGKSGFVLAETLGIRYAEMPDAETVPFFLAKELKSGYLHGVRGSYRAPEGYYVDPEAAERFDAEFPPKEKLRLPGQLE